MFLVAMMERRPEDEDAVEFGRSDAAARPSTTQSRSETLQPGSRVACNSEPQNNRRSRRAMHKVFDGGHPGVFPAVFFRLIRYDDMTAI